ncbi:MAG: GlsB/YeaQ/YmgE family stress response membrane protein [Rhodobiaceae bacterium]|nr:GlsB/YeaQ/YmgE family stress response membrane protein [Rhodobiaceae bacterium]MCC0016425.1 GlsB/YeaQ/YmgE family stress response membrane protein [Rhodobiaceae bacterium]MCC0052762.1 GlsB/YeaQ/YmgE family stress response membrane protein [Rhodobiaceae bacterium]
MDAKSLLIFLLIGLVAGWLASFIVGGGGLVRYLLTGVVGSFVGGWLAAQFNIRLGLGSALAEQIIISTAGAIIVVLVARMLA